MNHIVTQKNRVHIFNIFTTIIIYLTKKRVIANERYLITNVVRVVTHNRSIKETYV